MPTVLRVGSLRFHFYSDEGNEPAHIHVRTPDGEAKFWLYPNVLLAYSRGLKTADLKQSESICYKHLDDFISAYQKFHNGQR